MHIIITLLFAALSAMPAYADLTGQDGDIAATRSEQVGAWTLTDTDYEDGGRSIFMERINGANTARYSILGGSSRSARLSTSESSSEFSDCGATTEFRPRGALEARPADVAATFAAILADSETDCNFGGSDPTLEEAGLAPAVNTLESWITERPYAASASWDKIYGSTSSGNFGYGVSHYDGALVVQYLVPSDGTGAGEVNVRMFECDALWSDTTEISPPDAALAERVAEVRLNHFSADCGFSPELPSEFVQGLADAFARVEAEERANSEGN